MSQETKLGIFILTGLITLIVSVALLGDFSFQRRYTLHILFNDIAGLPAKAKVKIAGVEVGAVKDITLEGNKARVTVWIRREVKVHVDARASIAATGLIGSKFLELTSGTDAARLLADGDMLTGTDPVSFDKIVAQVMKKFDQMFGGKNGDMAENLGATLANLREVTDTLRLALKDQEDRIKTTISNFEKFSGNLADITADNKEDIRSAIKDFKDAAGRIDGLLAKLEKGDGTIGKLMNDKEMGDNLKDTVTDLKETMKEAKRTLKRINSIETDWDYTMRYDPKYTASRHDLGLRVIPNPNKFYYVGVTNLGDKKDVTTDPEEMNTFDALIGKQWSRGSLYAGIIRSKGGVGASVKPFGSGVLNRIEVDAEAYHFARKDPVAKARVRAGIKAKVKDWLYLGAHVEDVFYDASVNADVNLRFRDDDIGYVLGMAGLASKQ